MKKSKVSIIIVFIINSIVTYGQSDNGIHLVLHNLLKQQVITKNDVDSIFRVYQPKISTSVYNHINGIVLDAGRLRKNNPLPLAIFSFSNYELVPLTPTPGNSFQINYSISNYSVVSQDKIAIVDARLYLNNVLQGVEQSKNNIKIPNDSTISGAFNFTTSRPGKGYKLKLYLKNQTDWTRCGEVKVLTHDSRPCPISDSAEINFDISAQTPQFVDNDLDGIDDNLEHHLLEKFRPYFKFSNGESRNPIDCIRYMQLSDLVLSDRWKNGVADCNEDGPAIIPNNNQENPSNFIVPMDANLFLFDKTNITINPVKSSYHIRPKLNYYDTRGDELARNGATWTDELNAKNIGLYGHVVPITLKNPDDYDMKHIPSSNDFCDDCKTYYKIEYWQFFGFNEPGQFGAIGDHESDWTTVQLIVDPVNEKCVVVLLYAHGFETRFCMDQATNNEIVEVVEEEDVAKFMQYTGQNYNTFSHDMTFVIGEDSAAAQNNIVRFYKDLNTNEWSHPVAYLENGSHELWPSQYWNIKVHSHGANYACPDHNGDGHSFLTNTPPNLGEVEYPMNEIPLSNIILQYNGYWGCWSQLNSPPPGPTLHNEWTWPTSSSIRWLLKGLEQ